MILLLLKAVLDMLVLVMTNPLFILAVLVTVVLFSLSKVIKHPWAGTAWAWWVGVLTAMLNDFKSDPVALIVLAFVVSVNLTIGLIAVSAYFVARKLGVKL